MVKKSRKLSAREQFEKEQIRVLRAITKLREQGYDVDTSVVPTINKNVTQKKLKAIKKLTTKKLKELAYTYDIEGEKISYKEHQKQLEGDFEDYPTFDRIEMVRDLIQNLERKVPPPFPLENRKMALLSIFEDTITYYSENLTELDEYLGVHEAEIASNARVIEYDSLEEMINASFARLGTILNVQPLSPTQAESLSSMADYFNY